MRQAAQGRFRALAAGLVLVLCTWSTPPPAWAQATDSEACTAAQPITQARRIVTQGGQVLADARVALPDRLPLAWRNERVHVSYELDVAACANQLSASLWLFRVGAPFQARVNGQALPSLLKRSPLEPMALGGASPAAEHASLFNGRIPALLALPAGARQVRIDLLTLPYIPSGLTLVQAGPTNLLLPIAVQSVEDVVGYADAAAGVLLVLALMALVLWPQRPHDMGFFWMTLACASWSLRARTYFDSSVHMPPLLFEQLNPLNILLTAVALCAATLSTMVPRDRASAASAKPDWRRLPRRVLVVMVVTGCVGFALAQALGQGALLARAYAQACAAGLSLWTLWWLWSGRLRMVGWHRVGAICGYIGLVGSAAHDMFLVTGTIPATGPSYLFWGFTVLLVVYAVITGDYIISTLNRAENSNQELERRIADKSAELDLSYMQLRKKEIADVRASASQQERERLLRDMHDGLGAQLMTALRGVERSALSREQIAQSLQDGMDELRMLMDSADMGSDLSGALAAWRNRWDTRLGAAGVQLHWHLDDSVDGIGLSSDTLLQIMRVLQEAATNVVKHARARNMFVQARVVHAGPGASTLVIELRDDGNGLSAQPPSPGQRGLKNMHHRAALIGARLDISSVAGPSGGCHVRLALPLLARDQGAQAAIP